LYTTQKAVYGFGGHLRGPQTIGQLKNRIIGRLWHQTQRKGPWHGSTRTAIPFELEVQNLVRSCT